MSVHQTKSYWIKKLEKDGIPVGKVNNIKDAINLEQIKSRNMIVNIKEKGVTKLQVAGNPIKISGFKDTIIRKEAPDLDFDKDKILREFKIKV